MIADQSHTQSAGSLLLTFASRSARVLSGSSKRYSNGLLSRWLCFRIAIANGVVAEVNMVTNTHPAGCWRLDVAKIKHWRRIKVSSHISLEFGPFPWSYLHVSELYAKANMAAVVVVERSIRKLHISGLQRILISVTHTSIRRRCGPVEERKREMQHFF